MKRIGAALVSTALLASSASFIAAQQEGITVNFPRCYSALIGADANFDRQIKIDEFLPFLRLYGPPGCFNETELTLEQIAVFNSLSCLCERYTDNQLCCVESRRHLDNTGARANETVSSIQSNNLISICTVVARTIRAQCPDLFSQQPTISPAPSINLNRPSSPSRPSSPNAGGPPSPPSSAGPPAGNNTDGGVSLAPTTTFAPSFVPSSAPSMAPSQKISTASDGKIPWWVWLLLGLLLLLLLLCCLFLICCFCRRRDEKEEMEAAAIGEMEDGDGHGERGGLVDDGEGDAKYRDGVPGAGDELNNRFQRGNGDLPNGDGFDNEGVNLRNVGGRGGRGGNNGGDGQTFDPYDSNGNYRPGGDGNGDGKDYRYKGDWDRLQRPGDGDDGDGAYRHYPGGKRLPGDDEDGANGINLRPTDGPRDNKYKKNYDDGQEYPGSADGFNPYDGGAHYDPYDPYGNGYNRNGRNPNGSGDWKNQYQRGVKDGDDNAAKNKVREEKPLGPGEIWGVLGEDDGKRSGDQWGPLWVYEKTLDSLKDAEAGGALDHSSDEEE